MSREVSRRKSAESRASYLWELATGADPDRTHQLCLLCEGLSMAAALAEGRPSVADRFLAEPPELVELADGTGAVSFVVERGEAIRKVAGILLEGLEYDAPVTVSGGAVTGMPARDRSYLETAFGIAAAIEMGSAFVFECNLPVGGRGTETSR